MDKRLVSILLLATVSSGIVFSGCDKKVSPDGETTLRTPAEAANTPTTTPSPSPTSTPTPTPSPTPVIITETTYLYDEFVVHTDWSNYTPYTRTVPESVYTRLREDFIDGFYPSEEYGYIFPFLGETRMIYSDRDNRYGLVDINGQIVCDPIFYSVSEIAELDLYITTTISPDGTRKYGVLKRDGSFYSGQVYDHDYEYNDGNLIMLKRLPDMLLVTVYGEGCETVIPECEFRIDFSAFDTITADYETGEQRSLDYSDEWIFIRYVMPDGHALIYNYYGGETEWIDYRTGEVVAPCTYDIYASLSRLSGDVFTYENNETHTMGITDSSGNEILPCEYDYVNDLGDGTYIVSDSDSSSRLIDSSGNTLREYESRMVYADGLFYSFEGSGTSDRHIVVLDRDYNEIETIDDYQRDVTSLDDQYDRSYESSTFHTTSLPLLRSANHIYNFLEGTTLTYPSGRTHMAFGDHIIVRDWNDDKPWAVYDIQLNEIVSGTYYGDFALDPATGTGYILTEDGTVYSTASDEPYLTADIEELDKFSLYVYDGIICISGSDGSFLFSPEGGTLFHYQVLDNNDDV